MYDSSVKFPAGFLYGDTYQLGNYDECININVSLGHRDAILGKYCLPELEVLIPEGTIPLGRVDDDTFTNTWRKLQHYSKDRSKKTRNVLRWAICIPSSCTTDDLATNLKVHLVHYENKYGIKINVKTNQYTCDTKERIPLTANASRFW